MKKWLLDFQLEMGLKFFDLNYSNKKWVYWLRKYIYIFECGCLENNLQKKPKERERKIWIIGAKLAEKIGATKNQNYLKIENFLFYSMPKWKTFSEIAHSSFFKNIKKQLFRWLMNLQMIFDYIDFCNIFVFFFYFENFCSTQISLK